MDSEVVGRGGAIVRRFALGLSVALVGLVVSCRALAGEDGLREKLERELAAHRVVSASVAAVGQDGVRLVAGFGVADETRGRAAEATTRFRVASISKVVIALALLRLRAQGKVRLEDEVRALVPDPSLVGRNPWQSESPLRLVHLMENTSGWDDFSPAEAAVPGNTLPLERALSLRAAPRDCRWRPGSRYSYSNEGAAVAARVVETSAGRAFEDFVQDEVFGPLGMKGATYFNSDAASERIAALHAKSGHVLPDRVPIFRAAAGLAVSAEDMASLLELFLSEGVVQGRRYLPEADFARMERAESSRAGRSLPTAYGLFNQGLVAGGHLWRGHRGGIDGVSADFFYARDAHVGYFLALSTDDERAFEAVGKVLRESLAPEVRSPEARPSASSSPILSGFYVRENPRFEWRRARSELLEIVHVSDDGETMSVRAPFLSGASGRFRRLAEATGGDALFARETQSVPELVSVAESEEDEPRAVRLVSGELSLRRVSWARVLGELVVFALVAATCVSIPVSALRAALARRGEDQSKPLGSLALERLRHLCSVAALGCLGALVILRERTPSEVLGVRSGRSVAAFVASGLLPALVLTVVLVHVTERPRAQRWVSVTQSGALLVVLLVLSRFGWLGVRFWP